MIYNFEYDYGDKIIGVEVDYYVEAQVNKYAVERDSDIYTNIIIDSVESDDDDFNKFLESKENNDLFCEWIEKFKFDELCEAYAERNS